MLTEAGLYRDDNTIIFAVAERAFALHLVDLGSVKCEV